MMKKLLPYLVVTFIAASACESVDDALNPVVEDKICKITSIQLSEFNESGSLITTVTEFEYDTDRNILSKKNVLPASDTEKTFYTYNSEGYLIEKKTIGNNNAHTVSMKCEYTQGKIYKESTTYQGNKTWYNYESTYNMEGKPIQYTWHSVDTTGNGNLSESKENSFFQYTNGKLTKIVRNYDRYGNAWTETPIVKTNEKDLIIHLQRDQANKDIFYYNSDGELLKQEYYYDNNLRSYTVYEYDDKKNIMDLVEPLPKGHSSFNAYGVQIHNKTKVTYYSVDSNGTVKESDKSTYNYEYNAQGYPIKVISKREYNGKTREIVTVYTIACE